MRLMRLVLMLGLVLCMTQPTVACATARNSCRESTEQPDMLTEHWRGAVELPGVGELDLTVVFTPNEQPDGGWTATLSIPIQGLKDGPLTGVKREEHLLEFTFQPPGPPAGHAHFKAEIDDDGRTARGTLTQFGQEYVLRLNRITAEEAQEPALKRPQTPKPPFPYEEVEVEIVNPNDGTRLAGTLTRPFTDELHPAVILISGSGPQDRNHTIFGHQPFLVLSDHLTRDSIAVLRLDDRGMGGSTGDWTQATSRDLAGDILAAVEFLKQTPGLNHDKIGLIGLSEGGMIAPMVAAESRDVAFIVLLAAPGLSGREILEKQLELVLRAGGVEEERIAGILDRQRRVLDLVAEEAAPAQLRKAVAALIEAQGTPHDHEAFDTMVEANVAQLMTPWFRFFIAHDPREALLKVTVPVLALNGSLDLQVPAKENLTAIREALDKAGNKQVTTKELPGLNHLFQTATTGSPAEYLRIEETIAPHVLDLIAGWIRRQAENGVGFDGN